MANPGNFLATQASIYIVCIVSVAQSHLMDAVNSQAFKYQTVHGNFKEVMVKGTTSKIQCAAFCLLATNNHHCTTFVWDQPHEMCHCGYLFPFVTGQGIWENMYVKMHCRQSNISALIGVLGTEDGDEGNGLATKALGVGGLTTCAATKNMPSTNLYQGLGVVYAGGTLFSFGGKTANLQGSQASYKYELETDTWTRIADMRSKRYLAVVVRLNEDELFITGGFHRSNLKTTEIYNINTNTYVNGPNLYGASYSHCAVEQESKEKIFLVGGRGRWPTGPVIHIRGVQVFDMVERTFATLSSLMMAGRHSQACTLVDDKDLLIFAGGNKIGWASPNSVEILDLKTETWSSGGALPNEGMVWSDGRFLFLWGTTSHQYEPISNQWVEIPDVPVDLDQMQPRFKSVQAGLGIFCPSI